MIEKILLIVTSILYKIFSLNYCIYLIAINYFKIL